MAIEETIAVGVTGLGDVVSLADALDKAAASAARLDEAAGKGFSFSTAGADKLAASYEAAFAKINAQADAMARRMADLGKIGGGDSAAASLGAIGDAGKSAAAGLDAAASSGAAAGDALKGVGGAGDSAAAGLAGAGDAGRRAAGGLDAAAASAGAAGDAVKGSAAQMAEYNAVMADSAKIQRDTAAVSADAQAKIALGQRLNTQQMRAASSEAVAAQRAQSAAARDTAAAAEASSSKHSQVVLGLAAALGYGVYKAAQLQTSVTRLYTSAGEAQANLPMMTQGILKLSGQTATSQSQLGQGAYMVESGGYHGKDALSILRAAAEGAQAEGAPLGEVGNALTSLMTSYKMPPSQAVAAMNQIITMVGSGKMTMAGAAAALPQVLPAGAMAGLSFGQVGGALATMTQTGMSPDQASQNLRHTIGSLQGPNAVQNAEMYQLGLDPVSLSKNLGRTGLSGTVSEIQAAVKSHTGKDGLVQLDTMNASKAATADALVMLQKMPPALQTLGKAYLDNSITQKQWMTDLKGLPPLQANLGHQFATVANAAHGFNAAIKAGQPAAQTTAAALQKLLGGTVGFQTYLMLSGQHLATFKANAEGVSAAARDAGTDVKGWGDIQKTFNFQLQAFKYSAEAAATTVGSALLPAATGAMKILAGAGTFLAQHPAVTKDLTLGGGILAAGYAIQKVQQPVTTALQGVGKVAQVLHIPGLDKLAGIGKDTGLAGAATGLSGAAGSLDGAAASLEGAAASLRGGSLGGSGLPGAAGSAGRGAASAAERDAASAAEGAAGAGIFSKILGGGKSFLSSLPDLASRMAMPLAIAATAKGLGDQLAPKGSQAGAITSIAQHSAGPQASIADAAGGWFGLLAQHIPSGIADRIGGIFGGSTSAGPKTGQPLPNLGGMGGQYGYMPPPPPSAAQEMPRMLPGAGHPGTVTVAAPVKVPAPDLSAVEGATAKAKNALQTLSGISVKPAKIPAPDMSGPEQAKAKAMDAGQGIANALKTPLQQPVKAHAPDLSAFASARGAAQSDGAAISAGLAAGISAGAGAAVGAAHALAAEVTAALNVSLKVHSPSEVTRRTGEEFAAGLAAGISHGKSKAKTKSAAAELSASTVNSLVLGLQGGQSAVDAAMTALGSPAKPQDITTITSTVAKLKTELAAALTKGTIGKAEDSALTKMLDRDNKRLQQLAADRTRLEQEIQNAQQVGTSAISEASILNAGQALPMQSVTPQSGIATAQGMQYQAQQQSEFAAQLAKAKKEGLNATSLSQLAQGGAGAGLPVLEGLDPGSIAQVNQSEKSILKSAGNIGDIGGPAMYQAGQQAGAAIGQGLKASLKGVDGQMKAVAQGLTSAVKAAVGGKGLEAAMHAAGQAAGQGFASGIASETSAAAAAARALAQAAEAAAKAQLKAKSPSVVFADLGGAVPQGFAQGIDGGKPLVLAAVGRMAQGAASAGRQGMMQPYSGGGYGSGGGHGGTTVHNHYSITVSGAVVAGARDLLDTVQEHQLVRANNNWAGGLSLPGRRA